MTMVHESKVASDNDDNGDVEAQATGKTVSAGSLIDVTDNVTTDVKVTFSRSSQHTPRSRNKIPTESTKADEDEADEGQYKEEEEQYTLHQQQQEQQGQNASKKHHQQQQQPDPGECYYKFPVWFIGFLVFCVLVSCGIALCQIFSQQQYDRVREHALEVAVETGNWFAKELDYAILPLFSIAQFATELSVFADLPNNIGPAYINGSLPFLYNSDGSQTNKRNISGVCDIPEVTDRFHSIAAAIKRNAKMDGILHNIQLAPEGVICLVHPVNNTKDFQLLDPTSDLYLDSSGALGLDLLHDSFNNYIARQSLSEEEVGIAGPRPLTQCSNCGLYFIARLPIQVNTHDIVLDKGETVYPNRWGFATALIHWDALVLRSPFYSKVFSNLEYRLTRTDRNYIRETDSYVEDVVVLAQSDGFSEFRSSKKDNRKSGEVSTALQTTNNEWVLAIQFPYKHYWSIIIKVVVIVVSLFIAMLVYTVLVQKQEYTEILGHRQAQEAKISTERNITAYFAHELRNPLSALHSALQAMPELDTLPPDMAELLTSMNICTTFMANIMNNLLDVRKMEEGKMRIKSDPLSLSAVVHSLFKMTLPSVKPGVELRTKIDTTAEDDWVLGDEHRIQQIMTNTISNAVKYTLSGSIFICVGWVKNENGDDMVQFECQDTGPGIPKEEQGELFERFTTRGGAPGSGLGLAISKQMIELMNGSIRFESDPTVKPGTNCIVRLPMRRCDMCSMNTEFFSLVPSTRTNDNCNFDDSYRTMNDGLNHLDGSTIEANQEADTPHNNTSSTSHVENHLNTASSQGVNATALTPPSNNSGPDNLHRNDNNDNNLVPTAQKRRGSRKLLSRNSSHDKIHDQKPKKDATLIDEPISILIIDDIKMNRTLLKRRIKKCIAPNSIIGEAPTGEEAIQMIVDQEQKFDVLIVDQYMEEAGGVMVGTDVIIALRRSHVTSTIIGCSGNALKQKFLHAGANLVWNKPMPTNSEIIEQLRTHVEL